LLAARTLAFFGVSDTRRAVTSAILPPAFNLDNFSGLNLALLFEQFRIAPDMLVPLFLDEVATAKDLGQRPQFGLFSNFACDT